MSLLVIRAAAFGFLFLLMIACKGGNEEQLPVDFVWDRVACEECKMALSDPRYAAQVIDPSGRAYYFDDILPVYLFKMDVYRQNPGQ